MKRLLILLALVFTFVVGFSQQQTINVGSSANDHTGDALRTAFQKTNSNFTELYGQVVVSASASGPDTYVTTPDPATALVHGRKLLITFQDENTGPSTLNPNTLGAHAIKKFVAGSLVDLEAGDIPDGSMWLLTYDGTNAVYQINIPEGGGGGGTWGTLVGTLSDQTDLQGALDAKEEDLTFNSPLTRSTNAISIQNTAADGSTKGAASFTTNDFNAASGLVSIDYTNGQSSSGSTKGFLSSTDWTTFNSKVSTTRTISTTTPLAGGGDLSGDLTLSIGNAAADGSTKGAASFASADFSSSAGNISLDYANAQSASTTDKGFLTSTDWNTFNGKVSTSRTINTTSPLAGGADLSGDLTLSVGNASANGSTKGVASFAAADFDASSGNISIDYTNGQAASGSTKGFLTSTDWTTFNNKLSTSNIEDVITDAVTTKAPSENVVYDALAIVYKYALTSASASTSGGTITFDFQSTVNGVSVNSVEKMFVGSATFSTAKAIAFSNSSSALVFNFDFEITNIAATLTFPSGTKMSDSHYSSLTWTATTIGTYEMGGSYNGSYWKIKIVGPFN